MEYFAPRTLDEALALKARYQDEALVLAGGQSLSVLLDNRLVQPAALISLQNVEELARITSENGTVTVGAGVTMARIIRDATVREQSPVLAGVTSLVASAHVRSLGTLVGNLCHAEAGSDPPQALLVLNAEVLVVGESGQRAIGIREFIQGHFVTAVQPDEIATGVRFPPLPGIAFHYTKFRRRQMDLAVVGVVAQLVEDGASRYTARIAVGGTGERPERLDAPGTPPLSVADLLANAGDIAAAAAAHADVTMSDVFGSADYRRHLVRVGAERGIREACGRLKLQVT